MNKLQNLYEFLVEEGIEKKSFEDFQANFVNNGAKQKQLHDFLTEEGLEQKSFKEFQSNFFEKKSPIGSEESTDSSSNTSVPGVATGTEIPIPFIKQQVDPLDQFLPSETAKPKERNLIKTFGKAAFGTAAYQIPAAFAATTATSGDNSIYSGMSVPGLPGGGMNRLLIEQHYQEELGDDYLKEMDKEMGEFRKGALRWAINRSQKGQDYNKELIQRSDEINDPIDLLNYVAFQIGNTTPQIAMAIIPGVGTYGAAGQEIGNIYMEEVRKISNKTGLTPEEVIDRDLDDTASAVAFGTMAGMLEKLGATKVVGSMKKGLVDKALKSRAKSFFKSRAGKVLTASLTEGTTEALQEMIAEVGSAVGSGTDINIEGDQIKESFLAGATGGGGLTTIGQFTNAILSRPNENKETEEKENTTNQETQQEKEEGGVIDSERVKQLAEKKKELSKKEAPEEGEVVSVDGKKLEVQEVTEEGVIVKDEEGNKETIDNERYNKQVVAPIMEEVSALESEATKEEVDIAGKLSTVVDDSVENKQQTDELIDPVIEDSNIQETSKEVVDPVENIIQPKEEVSDQSVNEVIEDPVIEDQVMEDKVVETDNLKPSSVQQKLDNNESFTVNEFLNEVNETGTDQEKAVANLYSNIFKEDLDRTIEAISDTDESVSNSMGLTQTKFVFDGENVVREGGTNIKYNPNLKAQAEKLGISETELKKRIVMHELGHHATIEGLATGRTDITEGNKTSAARIYKRLDQLRKKAEKTFKTEEFQAKLKESGIEGHSFEMTNGFNNVFEFATEILTNEKFKQMLELMPADKKNPVIEFFETIMEFFESFSVKKDTLARQAAKEAVESMKFFTPGDKGGVDGDVMTFRAANESARLTPKKVRAREVIKDYFGSLSKEDSIEVVANVTGLTNQEVTAIYDSVERTQGKSVKVPASIANSKFFNTLKSIHTKYLSSKGHLPKNVRNFRDLMNGTILKETEKARNIARQLEKAIKKHKLSTEDIDTYLRDEDSRSISTLPDDVKILLNTMRIHIDTLSETLINEGYVKGASKESVQNNLGEYLNRSYEIFTNKKYKPSEDVRRRAKAYLKTGIAEHYAPDFEGTKEQFETLVDSVAEREINKILAKPEQNFQGVKTTGSKDTGLMMQKKDIPEPIRALLGEITDPVHAYVNTIYRVSNLVETNRFLHNVRQLGMNRFLFTKNDPSAPADHSYRIAGDQSPSLFPLNGLYTTKEIFDALKEIQEKNQDWAQFVMKANSIINWSKTVGSYVTHARNVIGNIPFMVSNAYDPRVLSEALTGVAIDTGIGRQSRMGVPVPRTTRDQAIERMVAKLKDNGVIGQNVALGVIKDVLNAKDVSEAVFRRVKGKGRNFSKKVVDSGVWLKNGLDRLYSAEDDVFKIIAFLNESNRYAKAIYNRSYKNLTESEQLQVDQISMEIVKNVLPNYSRLGPLMRRLSRNPFIGNFIAFQSEALRVTHNNIEQMLNELRSDNPRIRQIGRNRLIGIGVSSIGRASIVGMFGHLANTGIQGLMGAIVDDEEEDEKQMAIREYLWPWMRNDDLVVMKAEDGKLNILSLSATDPHGSINKSINSMLYADGPTDGAKDLAIEWGTNFLSETILLNYITSILSNRDSYGDKIAQDGSTAGEAATSHLAHALKTIGPTTINSATKIYSAENKGTTIMGQLSGMQPYEIDVKKSFEIKVGGFARLGRGTKQAILSSLYKDRTNDREKWEESVERANRKYKRALDKIKKQYEYAIILGTDISQKDLHKMLRNRKEVMYIMSGGVPPKLNTKSIERKIK